MAYVPHSPEKSAFLNSIPDLYFAGTLGHKASLLIKAIAKHPDPAQAEVWAREYLADRVEEKGMDIAYGMETRAIVDTIWKQAGTLKASG